MTAAIIVIVALVGVGIVVDALFRLRDWLNRPPPTGQAQDPSDDGGSSPPK